VLAWCRAASPVIVSRVTAPPKGPTFQYGQYILSYQDCRECHGKNLTGGTPGQLAPLGPDLNLVKYWKLVEFIAAMRTGVDPTAIKSASKCRGVRSDEWMMTNWPPSMNISLTFPVLRV
jgi:hypothetical protein